MSAPFLARVENPLISSRHLQRRARLALLAMFLLLVAPLLSQGLVQAQAGGLPAWLDELACGDGAPAQHGGQSLWAKCGYCTLLLASPAVPGAMLDFAGVAPGLAAHAGWPLTVGLKQPLPPHDAPPRAPPPALV